MSKAGPTNLPAFKTSVKRSSTRATGRTTNIQSATATARTTVNANPKGSPVLRGHKRKQGDELPDPPAVKKMSSGGDLATVLAGITARLDKIDNGLKVNATKDDVTRVQASLNRINTQMNDNTDKIEWLIEKRQEDTQSVQDTIKEAVREYVKDNLDKQVNDKINDLKNSPLIRGDPSQAREKEQSDFNDSRRSMRMWPILKGDESAEKAARDFMVNILEVPRITVARIRIDFVRRVSGARRSRVENEALVRFGDAQDRDVIQSYAVNLSKHAGKAGIRLDIPVHLRHIFRLLESHSSELKRRFPNAKRSIKFDDMTRSLVLDAKIDEEEGWIRIEPEMAEQSRKLRGQQPIQGRVLPGGKAGRRALMMPSPAKSAERTMSSFTSAAIGWMGSQRGSSREWSESEGESRGGAPSQGGEKVH